MSDLSPKIRSYELFGPYPPEIPEAIRFLAVRDSLNISFYIRRPHSKVRYVVADALDAYCQAVGRSKLTCYAAQSGQWRSLDSEGWAFIQDDLLQPESASILLREHATMTPGHEFSHLGLSSDGPGDWLRPNKVSFVSFWLPTEYLEERGPDWVRALALRLGAHIPFSSGHAGLFLQPPPSTKRYTKDVREACFAYPGIDILDDSGIASHIGTSVKGAHWMTFLGQPVLGELGGAPGLRARLHSPTTTVEDLGQDRVVVTLGKQPEFGDVEPERTLAPYRELARVLEPWLYRERDPWHGFTEDDMRRWERRLLD